MMSVTTFIAAYSKTNQSYLQEAVDSVKAQGVEPVVQFDEGVTHRRWSKAIASCDTEYIHIFSHDDVLLPGFYDETVGYLDAHPGCAAVFTLDYIINERGERIGQTTLPFPPMESYDFRFTLNNIIRHGNYLRCPSVVFRVAAVSGLVYPECDSASDTAMWFEVLHKAGPIGIIPKHLYLYRQSTQSDTQKNIIGTIRQWDHVAALEYAASLDDSALEWDTYIGLHKLIHERDQRKESARVEALAKQAKTVKLVVVHEPPDNAGTSVIAADRVRKANSGKNTEIAYYVFPDDKERSVREAFIAGVPCIISHSGLFGVVAEKLSPGIIEFHHTLGWGDSILNVQTDARKELYLHDLWMWRQHPHGLGSGKRGTSQFVAGVQGVYANGPWLQAEAKRELGCSVGLMDLPDMPKPVKYKKSLGYFGGFHPTKGIGILLQAMRKLPDYVLYIFSNVPQDIVNGRNIYGHDNAVVCGPFHRGDLNKIVDIVDVVVIPSLFESLGLVKIELESLGKKVIATKTGGMDGTVEPGNIQALVEAIRNA